jgi:heme/copper-type cytochrome/quinol oxidase subunit 2
MDEQRVMIVESDKRDFMGMQKEIGEKKSRSWLWLWILLVVIILGVVVLFIW